MVIKLLLIELTANVSKREKYYLDDGPLTSKYEPAWLMYHGKYREKLIFVKLFESQMAQLCHV